MPEDWQGYPAAQGLSARRAGRAADGESARLAEAAPGEGRGGDRVASDVSRVEPSMDHAPDRPPRRDVRHRRAGDQHGPAASEHARRAARRAAPRRREGRRRRRRDRLPAPRHREAEREPQLDADHPADRPHGLRGGGDQQRRLLRDGREADVARGAAARALRAHDPLRAAADCQPLPVARHARDGHRRDDGVPLRVPRARADSRSVRGVLRRAPHLQLDAHRRPAAGHSARLGQEGPRVLQDHGLEDRRVRGAADAQPHLARADQGHRRHRRRRKRSRSA